MNNYYSFFLFLVLGVLGACNDESLIGDNIIPDSNLEVDYGDQATITVKPVFKTGTAMTFPRDICALPNLGFIANYTDPIFGNIKSEIYAQFSLTIGASIPPNLNLAQVDSVILRLAYGISTPELDRLGFIGDTTQSITMEVYPVTEVMDFEAEYQIDQTFSSGPSPIGQLTFNPKPTSPRDLITMNLNADPDTTVVGAYESLRLDNSFGEQFLLLDSMTLVNDTILSQQFSGLHIKPIGSTDPFISFNVLSSTSRIDIHYTLEDTARVLPFSFYNNRVHYGQVEHDFASGAIQGFIDSTSFGDTLVILQGLSGLESEITISDINLSDQTIVNSAYLELSAQNYSLDPLYFPPSQLALYTEDSEGQRTLIASARTADCFIRPVFDGRRQVDIEDGETRFLYRFNITSEIQSLVSDATGQITVILSTANHISDPAVLKAYGPKSAKWPITLKITSTNF